MSAAPADPISESLRDPDHRPSAWRPVAASPRYRVAASLLLHLCHDAGLPEVTLTYRAETTTPRPTDAAQPGTMEDAVERLRGLQAGLLRQWERWQASMVGGPEVRFISVLVGSELHCREGVRRRRNRLSLRMGAVSQALTATWDSQSGEILEEGPLQPSEAVDPDAC